MKRALILAFLAFASYAIASAQITEKKEVCESDGFRWYRVYSYAIQGAQNPDGKTLIPLSKGYTSILYDPHSGGRFLVHKNDCDGVYDRNGKELISTKQGYTSALIYEGYIAVEKNNKAGICDSNGKVLISAEREYDYAALFQDSYYKVMKDGKVGVCDLSGAEIIPPVYDAIVFYNDHYHCKMADGTWKKYPEDNPVTENTSIATNTVEPEPVEQNTVTATDDTRGEFLYAGQYTYTGTMRTSDDFIGTGQTYLCNISVFEKVLYFNDDPPSRFLGYRTIYGENGRIYGDSTDNFFLVTGNGDVRYVVIVTIHTIYGAASDERVAYFDKGNTSSLYAGKVFSSKGNMNNVGVGSGYSVDTSQSGNTSTTAKTHKCNLCDGRGWIATDEGVTAFDNSQRWCEDCKKYVFTNHWHKTCVSCGGKGYW